MTLDVDGDFAGIFDGTETVALQRRWGGRVSGLAALRRGPARREIEPSGGDAQQHDVRWHLAGASLTEAPRPGDRIVDAAGEEWTILVVHRSMLTGRYRLDARNLAVAEALDTLVRIEQATWTKDDAGQAVASWKTYAPAVRAKVFVEEVASPPDLGATLQRRLATITLAEAPTEPLTRAYRIVERDGSTWKIERLTNLDRIDRLPTAECVESPWPEPRGGR